MASVQERLQLKRVPLENWSVSEQLYLASAVACSGDQNWMSVSRQLKMMCGNNRPNDWFSQKSCAAQYEVLLENVETPKRKKRNEKDTTIVETPIELIVRKLTQERMAELNKLIQEEREEYLKIKNEVIGLQNNVYDENQMHEMLQQVENEEKQREREKQKYVQWLKEREERKREMERTLRTNIHAQNQPTNVYSASLAQQLNQKIKVEEMEVDDPNAKQGTSPLLTSLLKSPSAAPNPSPSMLHNMSNQQTRVSAPTITNLLTGSVSNLSSSLAAAQQATTKALPSTGTSITTSYPTPILSQPLTGPAPNDQGIGNIIQSPSQAAPTLSMLLESKQKENLLKMPPLARLDSQNAICQMVQQSGGDISTKTEPADGDFNNAESPINEEQGNAVSNAADNLGEQVNLDLKNFQNQSSTTHPNEATPIKEEPRNLNENACDSTVVNTKMEDAFDELKEKSKMAAMMNIEDDKKVLSELPKDDDSDLSNDTPLSELIKQETSAKQQRAQSLKDLAAEPAEENQSVVEPHVEQPIQDESEQLIEKSEETENTESITEAIENTVEQDIENTEDLIDTNASEQPEFSELTEEPKSFEVSASEQDEKPSKIEIDMPIDSFESDSNEEKSMENIKREIEALPELKDSNSSDSQDEKVDISSVEVIHEDEPELPSTTDGQDETGKSESNNEVELEPTDENVDSTKDEATEQIESEKVTCDTEVEPTETNESEKVEDMETEPCQVESVESSEEPKTEIVEDSAASGSVVILDDATEDEIMPDDVAKEENTKPESDVSKSESDDVIEVKSDDEKTESYQPEEKAEKSDHGETTPNVKSPERQDETVEPTTNETTEKTVTPAASERKVSTDDELFEDAKETLETEIKPPENVTPAIAFDTDDDSPIEVIKEDKGGRTKRDYSRRKQDHSQNEKRTEEPTPVDDGGSISSRLRLKDRDRSESPFIEEDTGEPSAKSKRRYSSTPVIDSLPNSPASSDDREYRSWKKSILLLYNSLATHRYASIFGKPITEDQAPNYKSIVLNPMDLQSLKRNIDSGQIRTTIEFERYVMLMCYNAIFYNVNDALTCNRAREMLSDAQKQIQEFNTTWKKENEKAATITAISSGPKPVRGRKSHRLMN